MMCQLIRYRIRVGHKEETDNFPKWFMNECHESNQGPSRDSFPVNSYAKDTIHNFVDSSFNPYASELQNDQTKPFLRKAGLGNQANFGMRNMKAFAEALNEHSVYDCTMYKL